MIGLTAILVLTVCTADGSRCDDNDVQVWSDPTPQELENCATMADDLLTMLKRARCEVVPSSAMGEESDEPDPRQAPSAYKVDKVAFVL